MLNMIYRCPVPRGPSLLRSPRSWFLPMRVSAPASKLHTSDWNCKTSRPGDPNPKNRVRLEMLEHLMPYMLSETVAEKKPFASGDGAANLGSRVPSLPVCLRHSTGRVTAVSQSIPDSTFNSFLHLPRHAPPSPEARPTINSKTPLPHNTAHTQNSNVDPQR